MSGRYAWSQRLGSKRAPVVERGGEADRPRVGINADTLRGWCKQADVDAGRTSGTTTSEASKIKELERENRELKRANEILLAASSFFARELCATRRRVSREVVRDHFRWAVAAA